MINSRRCNILGPIKSEPWYYSRQLAISAIKILLVAAEREPLGGQHRSEDLLISPNATVVTVLGYFTRGELQIGLQRLGYSAIYHSRHLGIIQIEIGTRIYAY